MQLVAGVSVDRQGSGADFLAWLGQHATYRDLPSMQGGRQFVRSQPSGSASVPLVQAHLLWEHEATDTLSSLGPMFVYYADAHSRLSQVAGINQRGDVAEPPTHPLHYLQDDADLRARLDQLCQRIFRRPLTLDHLSGLMRLRVGQPTSPPPRPDESQVSYRAALARLPLLEQQGDGMKSLLGLVLPLVTATFPVILVDEPEAFLHPPQAFQLGQVLGELSRDTGVQLILATHDRNLLAGLLAAKAPLSVVRLTRTRDVTTAAQLDSAQVTQLWTDPVLRYSAILDGLFHQLVVLAEDDRDCRFYAAALDAAEQLGPPLPVPAADVLFVPSHGKAAMARLAALLRAVAVPVVASPDLDILTDRAQLVGLVRALGAEWTGLQEEYRISTEPFRQPKDPTRVSHVRAAVLGVLDETLAGDPQARYGAELRERVTAALRSSDSRWQALKDYGMRAFSGHAAQSAERLVAGLEERGLVPVQVGELERFAPRLGVAKGPRWLPAALEARAHHEPDAQGHVRRLLAAGGYR